MQQTVRPTMVHRVQVANSASLLAVRERLDAAGLDLSELPEHPEALRALLADPAVVVTCATGDGQPVGIAVLARQQDGRARIRLLAVAPGARRQGVGAALLTQALFAVLPVTALYVTLPIRDAAAIRWARDRAFRAPRVAGASIPPGMVEYELRLDGPAEEASGGCACGSEGCGSGGCRHH